MSWFSGGGADLREEFPIENLPAEVLGSNRHDALSIFYKPRGGTDAESAGTVPPVARGETLDVRKIAFFKKILPILDGFDNIFRYAKAQEIQQDEVLSTWLGTLDSLYNRLLSALEKEGLVALESIGKPLDLSVHDVVDTRQEPGAPNNSVIEELSRGYRYGNRVLRDAKVIVAKNPGGATSASAEPPGSLPYEGGEGDETEWDERP